jgi:hypothetical protein
MFGIKVANFDDEIHVYCYSFISRLLKRKGTVNTENFPITSNGSFFSTSSK